MKASLLRALFVVLLSATTTWAQKGIQFSHSPLTSVFQEARRSGKPVFVEIYSPTCHVCQSFVPTLADGRVGKYYNDKFVSTKLDIALPATRAFLERKKLYVPSLPLFLYFDPQENLIHFAMSNNSADEVVRHASVALNPGSRSQSMKARYQAGERSANFLIDYGMFTKVTRDTAANIKAMDDYARQQPAGSFASSTNWLVLQKLIMDMDNPLFRYLIGHLDAYKPYDTKQVKDVAENILMSSLYSSRGTQYPPAKILQVRQELTKIGIDAKTAANRTLLPEVNAYFRARQTAKAVERMDGQVSANQFSTPEYLYIARLFNRQSPDATDAPTVVKWVNRALTSNTVSAKEQTDLYYELAEAYRRGGRATDASKAAQKSMELAQQAKLDTRRNVEQLGKLK